MYLSFKFARVILLAFSLQFISLNATINPAMPAITSYLLSGFESSTSGAFSTGQPADQILSAIDFNNSGHLNSSGDGLFFNHPQSIASDDQHLILADGRNNRVLIWNSLPTENTPPDIVLGQNDFIQNNSGNALNQMNWPVGIATDGTKLLVTDAYNHRVLVWNTFPTTHAQSADFAIKAGWPWDVWTDGTKLIITHTSGSFLSVWDTFPTSSATPPSYSFTSNNEFGTPRGITTDGSSFMLIADHNGQNRDDHTDGAYSFYWKETLPSSSSDISADCVLGSGHIEGDITKDGKLIVLYNQQSIRIYNTLPDDACSAVPDVEVSLSNYNIDGLGVGGESSRVIAVDSDGNGVDDKLYVSLYNANKVIGFNSIPTTNSATADFVIGANSFDENTLTTNQIITNPIPACNGSKLFIASDFDKKLYVWNSYPARANQAYDFAIENTPLTELELYNTTLIGHNKYGNFIKIWDPLPTSAASIPTVQYAGNIGSAIFNNGGGGVAIDDKYMYVSNANGGKIYVWDISSGFPTQTTDPTYTIDVVPTTSLSVNKLHSDGIYLSAAVEENPNVSVIAYKVSDIVSLGSSVSEIGYIGGSTTSHNVPGNEFNQAKKVISKEGKLFVSDIDHGRIVVWDSITNALVDKNPADAILGQETSNNATNAIADNRLFWPYGMCFDGASVWVGENKFSGRILQFNANE